MRWEVLNDSCIFDISREADRTRPLPAPKSGAEGKRGLCGCSFGGPRDILSKQKYEAK